MWSFRRPSCLLPRVCALTPLRRYFHPGPLELAGGIAAIAGTFGGGCWAQRAWRRIVLARAGQKPRQSEEETGVCHTVKHGLLHVWYGSRLLMHNTRVAVRLKNQMQAGHKLTRREQQLLEQTTRDMLRMLPFSFFIIVPGAELLLPVALAMFPDLMPSTFVTTEDQRKKQIMQNLERGINKRQLYEHVLMKVMMAEKFAPRPESYRLCTALAEGKTVDAAMVRDLSLYFQKDGPLDFKKLPGYVLTHLAVTTGITTRRSATLQWLLVPRTMRRRHIRAKLMDFLARNREDDGCLASQDLNSLSAQELEKECVRRGMRWYASKEVLVRQLGDYLELSLDPNVPDHVLLFVVPQGPSREIVDHLSEKEREHILGLDRFKDTLLHSALVSMTKDAQARQGDTEAIEKPLESESMAHDLQTARESDKASKEEALAVCTRLNALIRDVSDETLLDIFRGATSSNGKAEIPEIWQRVRQHLGHCSSTKDSTSSEGEGLKIVDCAQRFNTSDNSQMDEEEFKALVLRIRSGR